MYIPCVHDTNSKFYVSYIHGNLYMFLWYLNTIVSSHTYMLVANGFGFFNECITCATSTFLCGSRYVRTSHISTCVHTDKLGISCTITNQSLDAIVYVPTYPWCPKYVGLY